MEKPLHLFGLYVGLDILEVCSAFPVDFHSAGFPNAELWTSLAPFLAVAVLLSSVVLLAGCLCCRQSKGFQEFTDSTSSHSLSGAGGYVNNAASTTEFTIFPPLPPTVQQQRLSVPSQTPGDRSSVVRFEPLPDIKPPQPHSRRPAAFNNVVSHGLSAQDWFEDPHVNFPRHQLKYLRELGRGWFGRAVEGEAQGIVPGEKTSKVVVKILHEDATATDHMYFLHEVKPYRDLKHPNILKLLGRCLETDPFLVLLEACPSEQKGIQGDLKSFLSQNISTAEAMSQQGVTLLMGCNIAAGLQHMHQHNFVHTDLAARNCLVTSDLTVKIGDYGTSIETFKDDYYCAGEVALPIRWCAPETLYCTETTIETKEVTPGANVWNLGVVLWEICEFGKLPYSELTDDEVIVKVLGEGTQRLDLPSRPCLHRHNLYHLMKLCWSPASLRPALPQVLAMLNHLYSNREYANQDGDDICNLKADEDFERRWEAFKPNTIPKTDNHLTINSASVDQSPTKEVPNIIPPVLVTNSLGAEIISKDDKHLGEQQKPFILSRSNFDHIVITPQDTANLISDMNNATPLTTSPQPSLTSSTGGEFFLPSTLQQRHKSPSLQNLRGSLDDLCECNGELNDIGEDNDELASKETEVVQETEHKNDKVVAEKEEANKSEVSTVEARLQEESIGTLVSEPEFDSWLQGVETTDEEDAKFVRKISEAIRDLDNALALEKTSSSSSSSETSSNSASHHQSPAKEVTPVALDQNVVLDFRLGPSGSNVTMGSFSRKEVAFQPDSLQDDSLVEKSLHRATDSGTDTEDETWRRRIECGEFSAKVKEKSKSVADLMVLTHIECSDGSDSEPPSPTWSFERSSNGRNSFSKQRRGSSNKTYNLNTSIGLAFGSESNIHHAVLGEEFRVTLMKLQEAKKDNRRLKLGQVNTAPLQLQNDPLLLSKLNSVYLADDAKAIPVSSNHNRANDFLVIDASEINTHTPEETVSQSVHTEVLVAQSNNYDGASVSENFVERKFNKICIPENCEVDVQNSSQVPEVEILFKDVHKPSHQAIKDVGDSLISENKVFVEKSNTSIPLNIPSCEFVESNENLSSNSYENMKCISENTVENDNVPKLLVIEPTSSKVETMLPDTEVFPVKYLKPNPIGSDTNESSEYAGISLFASSDILSELSDCEQFDTGPVSPSNDTLFLHPCYTSTPQDTCLPSNVVCNNCIKRNLGFEENVSEMITDFNEENFSFLSAMPSDVSFSESAFDAAKISNNTSSDLLSGTSTDSFDFIPNNENFLLKDSNNKSVVNISVPLEESSEVNLFPATYREPKLFTSYTHADSKALVILGPCEDYTLDYFKGLKTISRDDHIKLFDIEDSNLAQKPVNISENVKNVVQEERITNIHDKAHNTDLEINTNMESSCDVTSNCKMILGNKIAEFEENFTHPSISTPTIDSSVNISIQNPVESVTPNLVAQENFMKENEFESQKRTVKLESFIEEVETAKISQRVMGTTVINNENNVADVKLFEQYLKNEGNCNLSFTCETVTKVQPMIVNSFSSEETPTSLDAAEGPINKEVPVTGTQPLNSCEIQELFSEDKNDPVQTKHTSSSEACDTSGSVEDLVSSSLLTLQQADLPLSGSHGDTHEVGNGFKQTTELHHVPIAASFLPQIIAINSDVLLHNGKMAASSFLEQEIQEENISRDSSSSKSCNLQPEIILENENKIVDSRETVVNKPVTNQLFVTNNISFLKEKLNNLNSDLCVPSLNFIAATPLPSGRNSPELSTDDVKEDIVVVGALPEDPIIINKSEEGPIIINDLFKFSPIEASTNVKEDPIPTVPEKKIDEVSNSAMVDIKQSENYNSKEEIVDRLISSVAILSSTKTFRFPSESSVIVNDSCEFSTSQALKNAVESPLQVVPGRKINEVSNSALTEVEPNKNTNTEEMVDKLISSVAVLANENFHFPSETSVVVNDLCELGTHEMSGNKVESPFPIVVGRKIDEVSNSERNLGIVEVEPSKSTDTEEMIDKLISSLSVLSSEDKCQLSAETSVIVNDLFESDTNQSSANKLEVSSFPVVPERSIDKLSNRDSSLGAIEVNSSEITSIGGIVAKLHSSQDVLSSEDTVQLPEEDLIILNKYEESAVIVNDLLGSGTNQASSDKVENVSSEKSSNTVSNTESHFDTIEAKSRTEGIDVKLNSSLNVQLNEDTFDLSVDHITINKSEEASVIENDMLLEFDTNQVSAFPIVQKRRPEKVSNSESNLGTSKNTSTEERVAELNSSPDVLPCEDKDYSEVSFPTEQNPNCPCGSQTNLHEVVTTNVKTDIIATQNIDSQLTKEVPSKIVPGEECAEIDVKVVEEKQVPPTDFQIGKPELPHNITKLENNSICNRLDFEEKPILEERLQMCSEQKQFCFTEPRGVFVKNLPGKNDTAVEKWKQQNIELLTEEFLQAALDKKHYERELMPAGTDIGAHDFSSRFQVGGPETAVELEDDGEDFGLDVAKHSTPDDERSSDSGFRDKGSLSESCEDACDEKYNLEDIEAELEETFNKGGFSYVVKGLDGEEEDLEHHDDIPGDIRLQELTATSPVKKKEKCNEASFVNTFETTNSTRQENNSSDLLGHFTKEDFQGTSLKFDPDSSLLNPSIHSVTVNNMNVINCGSDYVDNTFTSTPEKHLLGFENNSTTNTPDLLNIETSDTPMPDLTAGRNKRTEDNSSLLSLLDSPKNPELQQPDFNLDHFHSGFSQKKDLMLDIGQTEFRAFSPEHVSDSFLGGGELSPIKQTGGWFLHPPSNSTDVNDMKMNYEENDVTGDMMDDVFMSPRSTSSTASNGSKVDESNNNENNYVPFSLDEEFVAAIRNELQEKLPCARQQSRDEEPEDDGIIDPEDDLSQEERTDITIHYNAYPPPLSPILEERESVSSITTTISDNYCPFISATKEATRQDSDSEPTSPVFILDSMDPNIREADARRFEEEIREALENCSLGSGETDSSSDKGQQNSSVLFEDLDQQSLDQIDTKHCTNGVTRVRDTFQQPDYDDDFLLVDTETNQATLLESPKPKSYLAFVNKRTSQVSGGITEVSPSSDLIEEEMAVGEDVKSGKCCDNLSIEPEVNGEKITSDEGVFTPDSISPGRERQVPSSSSLFSSDADNLSGFFLTPEKSSVDTESSRIGLGLQIPAAYNPYFASSLANHCNNSTDPTYEAVEEISLGVANNEAAEIISELESSGIFSNSLTNETVKNDFASSRTSNESNESGEESSRMTSENDSEGVSLDESSDSLKSGSSASVHPVKKSLSLNLPTLEQGSDLKRSEMNDNIGTESDHHKNNLEVSTSSCELEESVVDENGPSRLLLNDTLDLYKKKKASQKNDSSPASEEKDWSVTSLEAALLSTKAPMPSPEEESWKQIPSMLAFSDLNEVISRCGNEDGFGEAMFTGSTSPAYPPQENDDDLMSTSFSLKGDSDDLADCYTPDWESESEDTNDEDNNSSSSGEFIWKPYEGLSDFAMEVIAEEEEDEEDDDDEDGSTSSESGTEFVPSAWNSEATPNRSALRSPDKKVDQKKNVSFKKQKYHCVYEYPREVSDSESEGLDSPSRRRWELYQPDVDYASYADWVLMEGDVPETASQDTDAEPEVPEVQPPQTFDFYKLSNVDYDFGSGVMSEDGEFYISSSARPFQFNAASSDVFSGNDSQFFPGQLYHSAGIEDSSANAAATSAYDSVNVGNKMSTLGVSVDSCEDEVDTSLPMSNSASFNNISGVSLVSQNLKTTDGIAEEVSSVEIKHVLPKHIREITLTNSTGELKEISSGSSRNLSDTTEGAPSGLSTDAQDRVKVPVSCAPLTSGPSAMPSLYDATEVRTVANSVNIDNSVEKDLDLMETPSPSSPLSPTSGLGELRHTRDRLKLDLPASGSAFILDPPALSKRRSVEAVKGEASLLDSGEETEDSGIESSNGTITTSKKSQIVVLNSQAHVL